MKMGNDEFILYLRKNDIGSQYDTNYLGRIIWEHLRTLGAKKIEPDQECLWGNEGVNITAKMLPKTATQFEFDRSKLIDIFNFLDSIKN